MLEKLQAEVDGQKIFYLQKGKQGPPIIFIHGVPTSSYQWLPVQNLVSSYVTTYNIDLIGMGRSSKPLTNWDYSFKNDAKIIAALMDKWGYEKMIVAGDDWGGGIALTFAALYPKRTDLLITIDPVAYHQWPVAEIEAIGRLSKIHDDGEFQKAVLDFPSKISMVLREMVYKPGTLTSRDLVHYLEPFETVDYEKGGSLLNGDAGYGQLKFEGIKALAKRCASLDPNWMLKLDYSAITSPVQILWGENDVMMDPLARFQLKRDIINAPVRSQIVDRAGHLCIVDRPGFIAESILDFITEYRGLSALAQPYMGGLSEPEGTITKPYFDRNQE